MMLGIPWLSRLIVAWTVFPLLSAALSVVPVAPLAVGPLATQMTSTAVAAIETVAKTRANDGFLELPRPIPRRRLPTQFQGCASALLGEDLGLLALELGVGERAGLPQPLQALQPLDLDSGPSAAPGRDPGQALDCLADVEAGGHPGEA